MLQKIISLVDTHSKVQRAALSGHYDKASLEAVINEHYAEEHRKEFYDSVAVVESRMSESNLSPEELGHFIVHLPERLRESAVIDFGDIGFVYRLLLNEPTAADVDKKVTLFINLRNNRLKRIGVLPQ